MKHLVVDVQPGEYTVARLPADAPVPAGLLDRPGLVSVTRTPAELSVVCPTEHAPDTATAQPGWRLLTVRGPLEFTLTGIMAALSGELAAAGVSLFALSTYDTDHLLVKAVDLGRAVRALRASGHEVTKP
ncbi:ACT domain-containing protein [Saccharothrix yanglingensis]|uniref:Amino acid-binding protein n=1 Tax=Saccharothrix yanglingensis TaxID=659496 RepID=A0ABU0X6Y9_9PSEU|nr:ACT domain-containing protein [Saccharothrix yanglingensis]MDQ2586384.1 amino acid-binding protein [Saccharothrix yanglingensis]